MMETRIVKHPVWGQALFAENGVVEIGIPLEFGIRIGHLSYKNGENLFYEQPNDLNELCTPEGFRVRGGHRLWLAPESEKDYFPDNQPVQYEIIGDIIRLMQEKDPWLGVQKSMEITFVGDEEIRVKHSVVNTDLLKREFALWGVTSVAPYGKAHIPLKHREGGYDPLHTVTMWDYTSLGDERAQYTREAITLSHKPLVQKYKIGVGHPDGPVTYENKGVIFEKSYEVHTSEAYPDGGVSFEIFMCRHMVELECLSPLLTVGAGETAEFCETWRLKKQG